MRTANLDDFITFLLNGHCRLKIAFAFHSFPSFKIQITAVIGTVDKAFASHQGYRGSNQGREKNL